MEAKVSEVQSEAVTWVMWISVITGVIAIFTSQIFAFALDRYSRKVVMLVPFLGSLGLSLVCLLVAASPNLPLDVLYIGAVLRGLAGGYVVFKSSVSSYVVNLSSLEERTNRLAVVEAMLFLGSAAGPIGLQLLDLYGTQRHAYLFMSSECILILALLYIVLFLPDYTVVPENKIPSNVNGINNNERSYTNNCALDLYVKSPCTKHCGFVKNFTNAFATTFRKRKPGIREAIIMLLIADFFIGIVFAAEFDLLYLYMQDKLGFTLPQYSQYLAVKNLVNSLSLLLLLPFLRRRYNLSDTTLGILGGMSRDAAFLLLAFNSSRNLVYIVPFLDVFGQYLFVVLRSIISGLVDKDEQGRVLTVMSSMAQLSLLAGSVIFDSAYPKFLSQHHPGFTYIIAAFSMGMSTVVLSFIHCYLASVRNREELRPLLE